MGRVYRRGDRTARLLKLQILLFQYSSGLSVEEIARRFSTSTRTIYRDLATLETELNIPIWGEGKKRGIVEGYFLPPVTLTKSEAVNIFLAARLMVNYSHLHNPSIDSVFLKLAAIMPPQLRRLLQSTVEYEEKQPENKRIVSNIEKLTEAWLTQHKIRICGRAYAEKDPKERIIEPYFIEPSVLGRSIYIIGYCHLKKCISTFKVNGLIGDIIIEPDTFEIPKEFNINEYVDSEWDFHAQDNLELIKLRFKPGFSETIMETKWHPSQVNERQADGSIIISLHVRNSFYFREWLLGWIDTVEVLEPKTLRDDMARIATSLYNMYVNKG
jgi:predicted DNA-binding transcriptional regulator YafY